MKPYYEHAGITIYHGDCREILPQLSNAVAVVTDPPYGTGWVRGAGGHGEFVASKTIEAWDRFSIGWIGLIPNVRFIAAFCPISRLKECPFSGGVLWYVKTNPRPRGPDREPIICWPNVDGTGTEYVCYNGDTPCHPCQKDVGLMEWIVRKAPPLIVLDPFTGSGSTLIAAKKQSRQAIGIEIEEKYCEIAAKRLSQEVLDFG